MTVIVGSYMRTPWGSQVRVVAEETPPHPDGRRRWRCDRQDKPGWLILSDDDLSPVDVPRARSTDPETSHRAAKRAAIKAESRSGLLLVAHADAGDRGLTGDEFDAATGYPYHVIGPRRRGLEERGLVRKAIGDDGRLLERNDKQVYVITPMGEIEANRLRKEAS